MVQTEGQMGCKNEDPATYFKKLLRRKSLSIEPLFQLSSLKQRSAFTSR